MAGYGHRIRKCLHFYIDWRFQLISHQKQDKCKRHSNYFSFIFGVIVMVWGHSTEAQTIACIGDPNAKTIYQISIVPQLPQGELFSRWSPVLEKIGVKGGWCFDLRFQRSIPEFESALLSGHLDFAFTNPYHLIMAQRATGYAPLIADKNQLSGIVVVPKNSNVKKLSDLDGKRLAFPAPNAFAASLLTRSMLDKQGIKIQPIYVKTHSNVYRSVVLGDVAAGGGVNNTLSREPQDLQTQLLVLYETPGFTAHPIVVNPRVPMSVRKRFQDLFVQLAAEPENQALFNKIQIPHPIRVSTKDYEELTRLGIDRFVTQVE